MSVLALEFDFEAIIDELDKFVENILEDFSPMCVEDLLIILISFDFV